MEASIPFVFAQDVMGVSVREVLGGVFLTVGAHKESRLRSRLWTEKQ